MKTEKEIFELCDVVRQIAFELQRYLRHAYLEKIYENGLVNRMEHGLLINFGSPKLGVKKYTLSEV